MNRWPSNLKKKLPGDQVTYQVTLPSPSSSSCLLSSSGIKFRLDTAGISDLKCRTDLTRLNWQITFLDFLKVPQGWSLGIERKGFFYMASFPVWIFSVWLWDLSRLTRCGILCDSGTKPKLDEVLLSVVDNQPCGNQHLVWIFTLRSIVLQIIYKGENTHTSHFYLNFVKESLRTD